jgi:Tetracyclin repressor-like, C-terminal domain
MLPLIATRPVATPAAVQILEDGLALLRAQGISLARAMDILNAVMMFVIGHTLAEAADTPDTRTRSPPSLQRSIRIASRTSPKRSGRGGPTSTAASPPRWKSSSRALPRPEVVHS